jgi:osmotically-inducible protein OsmY
MDKQIGFRKIGPGRSLYSDDYYDDEDVYLDQDADEEMVWDMDKMHVNHQEGQALVGDDIDKICHYGKGPKGYIRSDKLIHEDVCEALQNDYLVDASGIDVTVDKGTVFLRGEINDRRMKREAERCVENVRWVSDVINELKLKKVA